MGYFRQAIEDMAGYTPGFQPRDTEIVKLNTNENPYPPSGAVMEVIRGIGAEQLRRYPDPTGGVFRQAAAELNGVDAENILCCNGGDDLLNICIRAFCDEKRPLAYPVPTYSLYPVLAKVQECAVIEEPFDGEYNLPAKLAGSGAALTIVCNPNAPSGSFIAPEELASLADELEGILLIDEAYVDFSQQNCVQLVKNFDNVIILRSMSKGYSLAGLRFGYAIAHAGLIDGLMKVRDSYVTDAIAIAAATAAIKDQDYHKLNIAKVIDERERLTAKLSEMGFDVPQSHTNFVLACSGSVCARDIYKKLIVENIYLRYFDVPGLDNKLRITIGTPEQNDMLLKGLKNIMSD
jgi:histidinol-phosphate aminotransferase